MDPSTTAAVVFYGSSFVHVPFSLSAERHSSISDPPPPPIASVRAVGSSRLWPPPPPVSNAHFQMIVRTKPVEFCLFLQFIRGALQSWRRSTPRRIFSTVRLAICLPCGGALPSAALPVLLHPSEGMCHSPSHRTVCRAQLYFGGLVTIVSRYICVALSRQHEATQAGSPPGGTPSPLLGFEDVESTQKLEAAGRKKRIPGMCVGGGRKGERYMHVVGRVGALVRIIGGAAGGGGQRDRTPIEGHLTRAETII